MITDKIEELEKLRAQTKELEIEVEREQTKLLASLPEMYGFQNVASFIKAVKTAARGKSRSATRATASAGTKRKRAKITPEIRAKVVEAVKANKTGSVIAKELGISLPSVQNIKKAAGLVGKKK